MAISQMKTGLELKNKAILEILKRLESQFSELKTEIKTDMSDHTKESADTVRALWVAIDNMKEDRRSMEKEVNTKLTILETEMNIAKWSSKMGVGAVISGGISLIISLGLLIIQYL